VTVELDGAGSGSTTATSDARGAGAEIGAAEADGIAASVGVASGSDATWDARRSRPDERGHDPERDQEARRRDERPHPHLWPFLMRHRRHGAIDLDLSRGDLHADSTDAKGGEGARVDGVLERAPPLA
jgi:hypothetical protein